MLTIFGFGKTSKFLFKFSRHVFVYSSNNTDPLYEHPPGGGGGTLIFSYRRRLGSFFGVQNLEFQLFLGFSEN